MVNLHTEFHGLDSSSSLFIAVKPKLFVIILHSTKSLPQEFLLFFAKSTIIVNFRKWVSVKVVSPLPHKCAVNHLVITDFR
jgi:hypothetical protein